MTPDSLIYVAGHTGMVGSAIVRRLAAAGYQHLLLRSRSEVNLQDAAATRQLVGDHLPEYIFMAAATVGGIRANMDRPADFITENLLIQASLIDAANEFGVEKVVFLGSSCIYPRDAAVPISEDALLTGPLEPTNKAYAVAKIAGITMLEAYRAQYGLRSVALMPCNLYGPHDNFQGLDSHVIPALMTRFHYAKNLASPRVTAWGTGNPWREFLHVDDLAAAAVLAMERDDAPPLLNVGADADLSIRDLAMLIADVVGYRGQVRFDASQPDGVHRKLLDSGTIRALGWQQTIGLRQGLEQTYRWFEDSLA